MKKAPDFASLLAGEMKEYINFMITSGRVFKVETTILRAFDRFIIKNKSSQITEELVNNFAYSMPDLSSQQYYKRQSIARKFSDYLNLKEKGEQVRALPKPRNLGRHIAYVYSDEEIYRLLEETKKLNPPNTLRPHTYYTLLGLLFSTGLRISEAINLNRDDIDFITGVLHIRNTKFNKSRLVPAHSSTIKVLNEYDERRRTAFPDQKTSAFFINNKNRRVQYGTVYNIFLQLVRTIGIRSEQGHGCRIHDLRHTFAIRRVAEWYDSGKDIHELLPILATFMGHAHFEDTAYYLTAGAELMEKGAKRFTRDGKRNE